MNVCGIEGTKCVESIEMFPDNNTTLNYKLTPFQIHDQDDEDHITRENTFNGKPFNYHHVMEVNNIKLAFCQHRTEWEPPTHEDQEWQEPPPDYEEPSYVYLCHDCMKSTLIFYQQLHIRIKRLVKDDVNMKRNHWMKLVLQVHHNYVFTN